MAGSYPTRACPCTSLRCFATKMSGSLAGNFEVMQTNRLPRTRKLCVAAIGLEPRAPPHRPGRVRIRLGPVLAGHGRNRKPGECHGVRAAEFTGVDGQIRV